MFLKVAVSSRALFHIEDGDEIFRNQGQEAFDAYMRSKEDTPLRPGAAFSLVKKLIRLNHLLPAGQGGTVKVVLMSRNSPDAGLRVANSIEHYGLDINQAVFSKGADRFRYAKEAGAQLFLSANPEEVRNSIKSGLTAACVRPSASEEPSDDVLRIAFDGDAVIFSDESDQVYQQSGLEGFQAHEIKNAKTPLLPGPLEPVFKALNFIQKSLGDHQDTLRIGLVTARGRKAYPRVVHTFRAWGLSVDEAFFCDGENKGPFLKAFGADVFFDDSSRNIENAHSHGVPSGHVPNTNGTIAIGGTTH